MYRTLIVVVDTTHARLFAFERSLALDGPHDGLYERVDLVNLDEAEFADAIAAAIDRLVHELSPRRVILCASPRLLGQLRARLARQPIVIDELADDFVKLTAPQLRDALVARGLLPARPPRHGLVPDA